MKYLSSKFTLPTQGKKGMTNLEYEIAVGRRCVTCTELTEECVCKVYTPPSATG